MTVPDTPVGKELGSDSVAGTVPARTPVEALATRRKFERHELPAGKRWRYVVLRPEHSEWDGTLHFTNRSEAAAERRRWTGAQMKDRKTGVVF